MPPEDTKPTGAQDNTVTAGGAEGQTQAGTQPPAGTEPPAGGQPATETPDSLIGSAGKTVEGQTETKPGEKAPESKAPDEYAEFKLPDGVTLIPELAAEANALFKGLNLTQEQAQSLVDLQAKAVQASNAAQSQAFESMKQEWIDETRKAFGDKLEVEMGYAARARDQFASPEMVKLLGETGLGNHVEVMKFFAAVGKAVAEDRPETGKTATTPRDPATIMYATQGK